MQASLARHLPWRIVWTPGGVASLSTIPFLLDLAAAVGTGALVGLEREHRRSEGYVLAGVRTFPLISLAGFLAASLSQMLGSHWPVTVGILGILAASVGFFYIRSLNGDLGFTTPMAIVVTFLFGALIGLGFLLEAIVVSVATTALLLTKTRLHRLAEALTNREIMGAVQFIALAFVAFPLARQAEGPYLRGLVGDGRPIDLEWTLLIVVAASALGFISFLALRRLGARGGLPAAGALGGLVNSEAATASVSGLSKGVAALGPAACAAVIAATGTSLVRNIVLTGIADPTFGLLVPFTYLMAAPILVMVVAGMLLGLRSSPDAGTDDIGLESPFAIRPALTFAMVFTAVNAAAFFLQGMAGPLGVYATSIGAVVSSGAVVASAANLVYTGTISVDVGLITAGLATVIGFGSKMVVVAVINRDLLGRVVVPTLIAAVFTVAGVFVLL